LNQTQTLQLCSTNPYYQPYFIHANEIIEVWKFVNYIASDLPFTKMDDSEIRQSIIGLQKEISDLKNVFLKSN
jgi:ADP-dependent phosphofructokinase/glucokinase